MVNQGLNLLQTQFFICLSVNIYLSFESFQYTFSLFLMTNILSIIICRVECFFFYSELQGNSGTLQTIHFSVTNQESLEWKWKRRRGLFEFKYRPCK